MRTLGQHKYANCTSYDVSSIGKHQMDYIIQITELGSWIWNIDILGFSLGIYFHIFTYSSNQSNNFYLLRGKRKKKIISVFTRQ